ncbi:MAG: hypothetical protein LH610_11685 [Sphingomonas bacterium]|nr:hypothetical protein [Sphingomonas bacterium]
MIIDLYSERERQAAQCGKDDMYQYVNLPNKLRVQVQQILKDAIGPQFRLSDYAYGSPRHNPEAWEGICAVICKEMGVHHLTKDDLEFDQVIGFLSVCALSDFIDTVEICTRYIARANNDLSDYQKSSLGISQNAKDALEEINHRFRRAGVGFQFSQGSALRVDSQFSHKEIVMPALRILNQPGFEGPEEEFLDAHRHYRNGDFEESVTAAGKAFESTLKAICEIKRWPYSIGDRTSDFLKIIRLNGLWPDYLDNSFDQMLATLTSGLPRLRNNQGAHGQGASVRKTPDYIASYAINLCASKIQFVAGAATENV